MKSLSTSRIHEAFTVFRMNHEPGAIKTDQADIIEARRQYYVNNVLKPHGIPEPAYIQKVPTQQERQQGALAFIERNKSLKYFINLIQQAVIK